VPVFTYTTDAFVKMREAEAKAWGVPGLRFVTLKHPYGQLPRAEAQPIAEHLAGGLLHQLRQASRRPLPA